MAVIIKPFQVSNKQKMKEALAGVKIIKVKIDRNGKKRFFVNIFCNTNY